MSFHGVQAVLSPSQTGFESQKSVSAVEVPGASTRHVAPHQNNIFSVHLALQNPYGLSSFSS